MSFWETWTEFTFAYQKDIKFILNEENHFLRNEKCLILAPKVSLAFTLIFKVFSHNLFVMASCFFMNSILFSWEKLLFWRQNSLSLSHLFILYIYPYTIWHNGKLQKWPKGETFHLFLHQNEKVWNKKWLILASKVSLASLSFSNIFSRDLINLG